MVRRILTIALAIVLAIIGTGAVLLYVKQADKRALAGQKAVTVLVAAQQIPAGTPASTALADGMQPAGTPRKVIDDAAALIAAPQIEVVIEATGMPAAGIRHALLAIEHGKHIVMVNVEADVLAGPLLAERAARAGVVYSMAYGDQPALVAEDLGAEDAHPALEVPVGGAGEDQAQ